MALHIKSDGSINEVSPKNGKDFSTEELHEYVGGYFEFIYLQKQIMAVNEDGWNLKLPINHTATIMTMCCNGMQANTIVGDVLVCKKEEII